MSLDAQSTHWAIYGSLRINTPRCILRSRFRYIHEYLRHCLHSSFQMPRILDRTMWSVPNAPAPTPLPPTPSEALFTSISPASSTLLPPAPSSDIHQLPGTPPAGM
ncbi:hypothetical protein NHQ30_006789 [Ciborinia camelliae]|nr:hypothetical protein NHQ30_006789 [Ciborinia camelliae]